MSIKRQFLWSMAPLLGVTVVGLVSVPWFVHYLGKEMYALWSYVMLFTGMFGFADLGLGVAVGRYIGVALGKGDKAAVQEYWATGNLIAIPLLAAMGLTFIIIGVEFGPKWFDKLQPENIPTLRWAFVCGGMGLFISYYNQFWLVLSQAHLDFKFIGIVRTCLTLGQLGLAMWLAYLTGNPVVLIFSGLIVGLLQLSIFAWHSHRSYALGWSFKYASLQRAKEMSAYTLKSFASMMVGSFFGGIDRLLLGKVALPAVYTYYNICNNVGARIQGLSGAIMGPVFHQTSRAIGQGGKTSPATIYNQSFDFVIGWYALAAVGAVLWHPVVLRLWLGKDLATHVAPAFVPLVIAYCLSALGSVSSAQLGPLNRMGLVFGFTIANGIVLGACVLGGWFWSRHLAVNLQSVGPVTLPVLYWDGLVGVAWGVLASRIVVIIQDLYVIRLIHAGGWLALRTWKHLLGQCLVGVLFSCVYLKLARDSFWVLPFAAAHGVGVATWLLRYQMRKIIGRGKFFRNRLGVFAWWRVSEE